MSMDALAEISAGTRSVEEIEAVYDEIMESSDAADVRALLGMSREEWTAFAQGGWFDELARWRMTGWPACCIRCGEAIVLADFGWMATEHRDEHVLVHVHCLAELLHKDQSIEALVQMLRAALGRDSFQVVDHWDADLYAIGIAACHDSRRLVYVSTRDESPGRYYFECESPRDPDSEEHQIVRTEEHATFDVLLQAIRAHLATSAPGSSGKS